MPNSTMNAAQNLPQTADALAEQIAQRCDNARQTATGWEACCPAHEDDNPSLSITPSTDKILLYCHAGCTVDAITDAIGMTVADLFLCPTPKSRKRSAKVYGPTDKIYDYLDSNGHVLHQTVRYRAPKDFSQRRPDPSKPGAYLPNLQGIEPVLYHLPDVLAAVQRGETVYLCEGEKDVDALVALGLMASCNPMGAEKWRKSYTETLRGADVILLPDNDTPGRKHGALVGRALNGTAHSVKVLALPGLLDHGDVSDWLQAGGTRPALEALVTAAPRWTPAAAGTPTAAADDPSLGWNDYVNARYLVGTHGQDLRYCWPWHTWFVWTGTHWQRDESGAVRQKAKQTIKRLAQHAADLDDVQAKALMAHVKKSLGTAAIKAMVESAQDEPAMPLRWQDLDTDGWLLNCVNGTLDLRTGTLRPPDRTDLLTRCLEVKYKPDALCPTWDAFLDRIMAGNQNLIAFLQRAVGYALTGVIREHVLLILWGTGRNGKSTFLNALLKLLGAYAQKAPSELLMVSQYDRHPTEKTLLHGKRFVAAIETEQGRKLAEAFVKEATGGDPITARRMREDPWTFEPTHKLFLATNHKPIIIGTDDAIWERPKLVSFTVKIPLKERDTTLPDKLATEFPGILAWAVRGCLAWQQEGLGEPDEVQQTTAGYRTEMDVVGQFISECCLVDPRCSTKANELYEAYKRWRGDGAEDQRTWGMALTERGFERYTSNGTRYRGIGILESVKDLRNQRNHTEPFFPIDSLKNSSRGETRKNGSVGSVGSVGLPPVENAPPDPSPVPDEGVI